MMTTKIAASLRAAIAGLALAFLILPAAPLGGIVPTVVISGPAFAGETCAGSHIEGSSFANCGGGGDGGGTGDDSGDGDDDNDDPGYGPEPPPPNPNEQLREDWCDAATYIGYGAYGLSTASLFLGPAAILTGGIGMLLGAVSMGMSAGASC